MDTILDINGIQTITSQSKVESYKAMINECEMHIFNIKQQLYEEAVPYSFLQLLEKKLITYKAIVNRLTQRIQKLESYEQ
jgi:hypothetical protein